MRYFYLLLSLLFFTNITFSQNCTPNGAVTLQAGDINTGAFINKIKAKEPRYSAKDVKNVLNDINRCNNKIGSNMLNYENKINWYYEKLTEVYEIKDVTGIKKQIEEKYEAIEQVKKDMESNLSSVRNAGIFAVIIKNIDLYGNKNKYLAEAKRIVVPYVIGDLLGEKIQRVSLLKNYAQVSDIIKSYKSGNVSTSNSFYSVVNRRMGYYIYVAKVNATSLKGDFSSEQSIYSGNAEVVNLIKTADFTSIFKKKGITDNDSESIFTKVKLYLDPTTEENQMADDKRKKILRKANDAINDNLATIKTLKDLMKNRSEKVEEYCRAFDLTFNRHNIDASLQKLLQHLKNRIAEKSKFWNIEKGKEIVSLNSVAIIEGDISPIGVKAMELVQQLRREYGVTDKMIENITVKNLKVTDYEGKLKTQVHRVIDQVWIYPVPQEGDAFEVTVFAKFKMTAEELNPNEDMPTYAFQNYTEQSQGVNFKMIAVKGGRFKMGSDDGDGDEKPIHTNTISDFYMAEFEVTQKLWREIMGTQPSAFSGDNKPVEKVSWEDVQEFIKKLNAKTGKKYRLPTEAEWEYVARGGKKSKGYKYAGSNDINNIAWYRENAYDVGKRHKNYGTNPVGSKKANELGLYDMSGNVREWCQDKWHTDYENAPKDGSAWESGDSSSRVLRGGSWNEYTVSCRVASRYGDSPDHRHNFMGFRLASSL